VGAFANRMTLKMQPTVKIEYILSYTPGKISSSSPSKIHKPSLLPSPPVSHLPMPTLFMVQAKGKGEESKRNVHIYN
jgi:hypothetical protein